jgi:hypothetical protein
MTCVRHPFKPVGCFKTKAHVALVKTEQALTEHNAGPQKGTGRRFAPSHLDNATFCGEVLSLNPSQQQLLYSSRRPRASLQHSAERQA